MVNQLDLFFAIDDLFQWSPHLHAYAFWQFTCDNEFYGVQLDNCFMWYFKISVELKRVCFKHFYVNWYLLVYNQSLSQLADFGVVLNEHNAIEVVSLCSTK